MSQSSQASAKVKGAVQTRLQVNKTRSISEPRAEMDSSTTESQKEGDLEITNISKDIGVIKETLSKTITKDDLENALHKIVQKDELQGLVTSIVKSVVGEIKESIKTECKEEIRKEIQEEWEAKLRERTGHISDKYDSLNVKVSGLQDTITGQKREITGLTSKCEELQSRSIKAIRMANFNEQYSRKCNVKIMNWKEAQNEDLREELVKKINEKTKIDLKPEEIVAIHRIPGKKDRPRPVIVKFNSSDTKVKVMRERKAIRSTFTIVDDVTKENMELLSQLQRNKDIAQSYYFNGHIYGKTENGRKFRFELFDDVQKKLSG